MFEFVVFLSSPLFGKYLPRLGYARVYLVGVLMTGLSTIILGTLYTIPARDEFIACCVVLRFTEAVGAAACLTAAYSIASRIFHNHVPSVMGILEMCNGLGLMTGPALGSGLYQIGGFGLPFYLTGALLICCGVASFRVVPKFTDDKESSIISLLILLRNPSILTAGITVSIAACGVGFLEPTLAGRLQEIGISTSATGGVFILLPLVYAISSPLIGFLVEKKDCGRLVITVALFVACFSFVMIGPTPIIKGLKSSVLQMVLSSLCFGLAMSGCIIPTFPLILETMKGDSSDKHFKTYSLVAGYVSSCYSLGAFLGPITGGIMVEHLNFPLATTFFSSMFFLMGIIWSIILSVKSRKKCRKPVLHDADIELEVLNSNECVSGD